MIWNKNVKLLNCWCYVSAADSRRPVSDSFPLSFSYSRSPAAQDSPPSARKEPLRKAASDASASDLVWKKAPGGPVSRQTSEGGAGKHGITSTKPSSTDVGKGKTITRQISKGVSIPCVQIKISLLRSRYLVRHATLSSPWKKRCVTS